VQAETLIGISRLRFNGLLLLIVAVAGSCVGCGKAGSATVTGTVVRKDGSALVGARVIAISPETGKSAYGSTDGQGRFELGVVEEGDGIPPGNYNVTVDENLGDPDNRSKPTIAAKYRDPKASGIRLSVSAGQNAELNVTLDPK